MVCVLPVVLASFSSAMLFQEPIVLRCQGLPSQKSHGLSSAVRDVVRECGLEQLLLAKLSHQMLKDNSADSARRHLHICTPAHLHTCTPVHLYTCSPVHLFTCTPAHLTLCMTHCAPSGSLHVGCSLLHLHRVPRAQHVLSMCSASAPLSQGSRLLHQVD